MKEQIKHLAKKYGFDACGVARADFLEYKEGKYQTIRTYAKMARGAMTRHILKNRIEKPEELHALAWEGFTFEQELSQRNKYIYTKK